ncbi:hypothetical protein [Maridesulfovibrio sp. FT414]|uniref:hypothetical protein n=1 Tax=Maridesulfovibrio sp. FT414 TaxID=2979469 RepID=UPI003D805B91
MDILIAFVVGSLAKLSSYVFIPYGKVTVLIAILASCLIVHITTKRIWLSAIFASVGFAGYELIVSSLENFRGLYSVKYELINACFCFVLYFLFTAIIHYTAIHAFPVIYIAIKKLRQTFLKLFGRK